MRALIITSVYPRSDGDDQVPWLREGCRRLKSAGVETEDVDCAPSAAANTLVSAAVDVTADPVIAVVDVCGY